MNQLFEVTLAFPTVILTIVVGIALVYWLFVILGALDIDLTGDADVGDIGGGPGGDIGGGDAGDIGDMGDAGGADAGHGDGGGDASHHAGEGDAHGSHGGGVWAALGLGRVPITISISLISFFAWIICIVLMMYLGEIGLPRWLVGTISFVAAIALAIPPAAFIARPLAPVFVVHTAKKRADYIGSVCDVTTGSVTANFGQARVGDGGDDLLIQVRCDREDVFSRHDKALIIEYDDTREAYLIEAMDSVMGKKDKN